MKTAAASLGGFEGWTADDIRAIAPALVVANSDVVRPEHAVGLFRLLGGGVPGDSAVCHVPSSRYCPAPPTSRSWSAPTG